MISDKTAQSKIRIMTEIVICYLLMLITVLLFNRLSNLLRIIFSDYTINERRSDYENSIDNWWKHRAWV